MRGSITKAGNTHVRRLLIESAWHLPQPRADDVGLLGQGRPGTQGPRACRQPAPAPAVVPVQRTQEAHVVANVATARELAGRCWS